MDFLLTHQLRLLDYQCCGTRLEFSTVSSMPLSIMLLTINLGWLYIQPPHAANCSFPLFHKKIKSNWIRQFNQSIKGLCYGGLFRIILTQTKKRLQEKLYVLGLIHDINFLYIRETTENMMSDSSTPKVE